MNGDAWVIEPNYAIFLVVRKFLSYIGYTRSAILNISPDEPVPSEASKPSLIFIDIESSEDAQQLFFKLIETYRDVPIIVLTSSESEATAMRAVKIGAQDYLIKDEITLNLFRKTVLNAIERNIFLQALRDLITSNTFQGDQKAPMLIVDKHTLNYVDAHNIFEESKDQNASARLPAKSYSGNLALMHLTSSAEH